MNDDRDPLDDTLAEGLRALAPPEFALDADRTLGEMRPRLRQARTRRRFAVSTSVLGALLVVVAGAAALRHDPASRVDVRSRTNSRVPTVAPSRTTTTVPRTVTTTTRPRHTPTTLPATSVTVPGITPTTTRPAPATPPPAPETKTYTATGGRITIRFANGRLTLVSTGAAPGYAPDVRKRQADDVEVRFSNGNHTSKIRVRVQNGLLRPEIDEN